MAHPALPLAMRRGIETALMADQEIKAIAFVAGCQSNTVYRIALDLGLTPMRVTAAERALLLAQRQRKAAA